MMRAPIRASIAAALLLGAAGALAGQAIVPPPPPPPPPAVQAQTAPASDDSPDATSRLSGPAAYTIAGMVVSASGGTPLDRAEVSLTTPGPRGSPIAQTITSENGGFRFDRLQAGKYRLEVSRRGYITSAYQDHDGFATAIVTGPDLDTSGLRFELKPSAIIGGTVTDDAGEPVGGAQVRLFRREARTGESHIIGAGTDITDDTGVYEFARLRAGTYFIAVTTSPWYAFHPGAKTDDNGNPLPPDQQPRSPLDVAYPTTYYPNALDSDSAAPLTLNAGDHVQADFSLHAVPAIHVQVRVPTGGEGRGTPMPMLMQQIFSSEQNQQIGGMFSTVKNDVMTVDLGGVAPGHYVLRQFGQGGETPRTAGVDLTSDATVDFNAVAGLSGGVDVSGKLAMVAGKLPERVTVQLTATGRDANIPGVRAGADGTFEFHSVAPGTYDLQVRATGSSLSVTQLAVSGGESQGNRITVAAEPVLIAASIASGSTTVTGYAKLDGKGVGGVMIVLVPRDPASHDLYRRDQSDTDGSFTLNRVVPGSYTLVAIQDGWTLEWARPEAIAPYLARGVRIQTSGQKTLEVPNAVEVQPR